MRPYQALPFQYSLHVIEGPGAMPLHYEYLHGENSNSVRPLLRHLQSDLPRKGTVLAWYMTYEKGCHDRMAEVLPEFEPFLSSVNERMNDLMIPFKEQWVIDKDFFGSASIKKVLPVMVTELGYQDLAISDGQKAQRDWMEAVLQGKIDKEKVLADLRTYCTLDTFAMVRIWEELQKL